MEPRRRLNRPAPSGSTRRSSLNSRSSSLRIIVGHGEDTVTEGLVRARRFGHLDPDSGQGLISKGLPTSYEGLSSRRLLHGRRGLKNFAERVAQGLRKAGYLSVTVKGNLARRDRAQGVEKVQFAERGVRGRTPEDETSKKFKREKNKLEKRRKELSDKMGAIVKGKSQSTLRTLRRRSRPQGVQRHRGRVRPEVVAGLPRRGAHGREAG